MKCNFCGGNISLEDELCPHCGRINRDAAQHIRDMKHFNGEFEEAKKDVYTTTRKYSEIVSRIIFLTILIALVFICSIAEHLYYRISFHVKEGIAKAKVESYSEILDNYIENEEYKELQMFAEDKYIHYDTEGYEKYTAVLGAARNYSELYIQIIRISETEGEDVAKKAEELADCMKFFYDNANLERYSWQKETCTEKNEAILENMQRNIGVLLRTYCGLTEEEAEDIGTMSAAKRAILIEEGVGRSE